MTREVSATAILLRSGDGDSWRFAVDLAGAGVASNDRVALVLFDAALVALLSPDATHAAVLRDLAVVRALGRATQSFEVIACSGAVERIGADPDKLVDDGVLDDVRGLPAIWRHAAGMRLVTI